jgi:NAD(P)-dependent dehydrogenase (short-subunit alcohol dehydrogenase family)
MAMSSASPRVWFITGASSGFGRALTEVALSQGDLVVSTARNPEALADLAARVPDSLRVLPLDVTQAASIPGVIQQAIAEFGRIDVLVNNAGRGLIGAVEETSDAETRAIFETNFFGPAAVLRALLPHFRERKSGHIVQMGAAAAIANYAGFGTYGAAKGALSSLTESLAQELKPLGIRVTLVEPGPFRTDFVGRSMTRAATSLPDYANTSARFGQYLAKIDGKQPGNPILAAEAIVKLVHSGEAPLRFVLGRYAIDKTRKTFAARERELAQHEAAGAACDGP